jgi:hypothetical protein
MPVLATHIAKGALILLDDADRDGEQDAMRRWSYESGAAVRMHKRFAIVEV